MIKILNTLLLIYSVARGRVQDPLHEGQAPGCGGQQTRAQRVSPQRVPGGRPEEVLLTDLAVPVNIGAAEGQLHQILVGS